MTLTEQWKNGKIEALEELINQIATVDDNYSLSDEYLQEKGLMTRDECGVALEYPYGIVMVVSDYILPYLKKLQELKQENQHLKELLRECRKALNKAKGDTVWYPVEIDHVLTQTPTQ